MAEYKIIESGAFADYEFEASADTLNELFKVCAIACFEAMTDTSKIECTEEFEFELEAENREELLFAFLAELIYLKDVESILLGKFNVTLIEETKLKCVCRGTRIDLSTHELRTDVKAVTYHHFKLEQTGDGYTAHVILDL